MDWKLGVAMSSSSCRSLSTPYISLQLKISDSATTTQLRHIEMTVPEFQVGNIVEAFKHSKGRSTLELDWIQV